MNGLLAGSLGLSMMLGVGQAPSQSPPPSSQPLATLGQPIAVLGKPVAVGAPRQNVDRQVKPVGYFPAAAEGSGGMAPLPLPRTMIGPSPSAVAAGTSIEHAVMPGADDEPALAPRSPLPPGNPATIMKVPTPITTPAARPGPVLADVVAPAPMLAVPAGPAICCEQNACNPCEEGFCWRNLPFFDGSCTDFGNPPTHFYASAEYLLWNVQNDRYPPLVTASGPAQAGVIGPGTTILYPPEDGSVFSGLRSGGRFTLGWWFGNDQVIGIENTFFFLGTRETNFTAGSNGNPVLARPFFNVPSNFAPTPGEASELVAFPNELTGSVHVRSTSQLLGDELNLRTNLCRSCCSRLDLLGGVRWIYLNEGLDISENLIAAPGFITTLPNGGPIYVNDNFTTTNNFYGGQVGLDWELRRGRWSLDLLGKVALGDMHEVVRINGQTSFPTVGQTLPGGLLALPSNIGTYSENHFAVVPEVGLKLGFQPTNHMRLVVGYSFLYLSDVVRPGAQIDRNINVSQLPIVGGQGGTSGATSPAPQFNRTSMWAQGISLGLEFRF